MAVGLAASGICRNQVSQIWPVSSRRCGQRIKSLSLFSGQPVGQPAIHLPAGLMTDLDAEPFECGRRRQNDPTLPAFFHGQCSQMSQAGRPPSLAAAANWSIQPRVACRRDEAAVCLALDSMALSIPFICKIFVNRLPEKRRSVRQ